MIYLYYCKFELKILYFFINGIICVKDFPKNKYYNFKQKVLFYNLNNKFDNNKLIKYNISFTFYIIFNIDINISFFDLLGNFSILFGTIFKAK